MVKRLNLLIIFIIFWPLQSLAYDDSDESFKEKFILKYNNYSIGSVSIVRETISQYILPQEFFKNLRISYTDNQKQLVISRQGFSNTILNYEEKYIVIEEQKIFLINTEYIEVDNKLYLESNSFAKFFDLNFNIQLGTNEVILPKTFDLIELNEFLSGNKEQVTHNPEILGTENQIKAIQDKTNNQVVIYGPQLPEKTKEYTEIQNNISDVEVIGAENVSISSFKHVEGKDFPPVNEGNYSIDNLLIFEIGIDDQVYDQLVDVYEHPLENDEVAIYISLSQLIENLEFSIDVDLDNKTAKGWFIKEDNILDIDFNKRTILINGRNEKLKTQDFIVTDEDIFFLSKNLGYWFPIDYEIKYNAQRLQIYPRVLLPFQERKIREIKRQRLLGFQQKQSYPTYQTPYQKWQIPEADITISSDTSGSKDKKAQSSMSFSASLNGDLAEYNTSTYLSGNDEELSTFRFEAERKDLDKKLFGTTKISEFALGDIPAYSVPLISGSEIGVGTSVSTFALTRPDEFDKTTLEGTIQPNWEVELYRNSQLISFQTVGIDGRYKFEDVDVLYGENLFKLVFYGPQGEIKEETKEIFVGQNILKEGEYNYQISANRINQTLFDVGNDNLEKGNRLVLQGEYGLLEDLTLSSTVVMDEFLDLTGKKDYHLFQLFEFTKELFNGLANVNFAYDYKESGYAIQQSYITRLFEANVNFRQEFYDNFQNKSRSTESDPMKYRANLGLNKAIIFPFLKSTNISLDFDYTNSVNGKTNLNITNSVSAVYKGYSITNNLNSNFDDDNSNSTSGVFSIRTNYDKGFYKFDARYSVNPDSSLDTIAFSTQRIFSENISARLDISQPITGDNITNFGTSLNYIHKNYVLGVTGSLDTESNYSVGVNLSFSLYQDPENQSFATTSNISAESGSVLAYAFLDEDNDGNYNPDKEELIEGAKIYRGSKEIPKLRDTEYLYSRGVPSYRPTEFTIDSTSLDDPLWYPPNKGYEVVSRPGVTTNLAFPVLQTAEVDGTIFLQGSTTSGDGTISGMKVFLIDDEGNRIAEATSEFDGYFMFERVVAGRYFLIASETQLNNLGLKQLSKPELTITNEDDYYPDNDLDIINIGASDDDDENKSKTKNTDSLVVGNLD